MINYANLLGIPFKGGGRDLDGLDCYGVVLKVYKLFGIDLPDWGSTLGESEIDRKFRSISGSWEKIDVPEIPSIVAFWVTNPEYVSHIGVVIDNDKFIHIREKISVAVERLSHPVWNIRIVGFYRWKNIN